MNYSFCCLTTTGRALRCRLPMGDEALRRIALHSHDGSGPAYTFFIETHLPSLSKTTSPWKAFSRDTLHNQPFSLLVTVTSLALTIPGPTKSEPYNDNMAAALILASSSVVIRINP